MPRSMANSGICGWMPLPISNELMPPRATMLIRTGWPMTSRRTRTASSGETRARTGQMPPSRTWPVYGVRASQIVIGRYISTLAKMP